MLLLTQNKILFNLYCKMIVIFGENWYNINMKKQNQNNMLESKALFDHELNLGEQKASKPNLCKKSCGKKKTQTEKPKMPIVLDVDTGIDDSVAIALALVDESLDIKLLTTCAGNTSIENVIINTLTMLQWFNRGDIPVAQGADKPLIRERLSIEGVHGGVTGMGSYSFPKCTLTKYNGTAVDTLYKVSKENGKITLICTAPATNLAHLFQTYPDAGQYIEKIVFQSGLLADATYPSFNVTADPEAMQIVIDSGVPLLICPSDMGHVTCLDDDEVDIVRKTNKTGEMFATTFQSFRDRVCQKKVAMHDSCAVACVTRPDLFEIKPAKCSIIDSTDGQQKIFRLEIGHKDANCECCTKVNIQEFKHYMLESLKKCD